MLKQERHAFITKQINLHNKVLSSDLCEQLNVSEDTVRRDLTELADLGKLLKVHGGALSKSFHSPHSDEGIYSKESKVEIAKKAVTLIKQGMVILTGGGTTMIEMAKLIPNNLDITVFTVSPLVALEIAERSNVNVILIGGQLSKESQISIGAEVTSYLSGINVDLCFLGANGIDLQAGITDSDWDVVQVKRAMLKSASKAVVLCISEKLETTKRFKVCNLSEIDYIITETSEVEGAFKNYAFLV